MRISSVMLFCCLPAILFAQEQTEDPVQRIKNRLQTVQTMAEAEQRTINLLEEQLGTAQSAENRDQINRLEDEISEATARLEELRSLKSQLENLMDGIRPATPQLVVRPRLQGLPSPQRIGADQQPELEIVPVAPKPERPNRPLNRLEHLQQALAHLQQIGEVELAEGVRQVIAREEQVTGREETVPSRGRSPDNRLTAYAENLIKKYDKNLDGQLDAEERTGVKTRITDFDKNGVITLAEIKQFFSTGVSSSSSSDSSRDSLPAAPEYTRPRLDAASGQALQEMQQMMLEMRQEIDLLRKELRAVKQGIK